MCHVHFLLCLLALPRFFLEILILFVHPFCVCQILIFKMIKWQAASFELKNYQQDFDRDKNNYQFQFCFYIIDTFHTEDVH